MTPPDYIFCGSSFPFTEPSRYVTWLDYYKKLFPDSCFVIVNDGPDLGHWNRMDTQVIYLEPRLGRVSHLNHAGLFRSLRHMCYWMSDTIKMLWIEWDFYILSQRCIDWVCSISRGLVGAWCPQHNFPETSMIILCQDQYVNFYSFINQWATTPESVELERAMPFTEVKKDFIGNRYSDVGLVHPHNADYSAQTTKKVAEIVLRNLVMI